MAKITFTLKRDGTIQAEADGFKGSACKDKIDELLRGTLFKMVEDPEFTDEYYETDPALELEL